MSISTSPPSLMASSSMPILVSSTRYDKPPSSTKSPITPKSQTLNPTNESKSEQKPQTRFIALVRHSKNVNSEIWRDNRDGKGRPYVPIEKDCLTEKGRLIAEYTGIRLYNLLTRTPNESLKHEKWRMYCSPVLRAQETAHLLLSSTSRNKDTKVVIDDDLKEIRDVYTKDQTNSVIRVRRLIDGMFDNSHNHDKVTVYVTHAMLIRAILRDLLKLPDNVVVGPSLAGITILETDGTNIAIHTLNDSHVDINAWDFDDLITKVPKFSTGLTWHDDENPSTK